MRFVVDASSRARCLVTGPDAAAFVHRMSTQHTHALLAGDARLNVLTTDKGRIVDVVHHVVTDDGILLLGQRTDGVDLVGWLDRYCFTEKLSLVDLGATSTVVIVDGGTADAFVADSSSLAPWQARRAGSRIVVRTFDVVDHDGVVAPAFVVVSRDPASAPVPAASVGPDDWQATLVAAGVPTSEIGETATPLDLGLHDAIHWAKGCYIGQEVIARLDTYGKQRKALVGVVGDAARLRAGDSVIHEDVIAGTITSHAGRPYCASLPSALAVVKGIDVDTAGEAGVAALVRGVAGEAAVRLVRRHAAQNPHD
jgi:folate-binding protein YgfZ